MEISIEQKRLLKKWALNFLLFWLIAIGFISGMCLLAAGLMWLGKVYGPGAIMAALIFGMGTVMLGTISYHAAKEDIKKEDAASKKVLDALGRDYNAKEDDSMSFYKKHLASIRTAQYKTQKKV